MLTEIAPRAMPPHKGATTALDHSIIAILGDGQAMEPRDIFGQVSTPDATLQRVHARLRVLVERGVVKRVVPSGAPLRGPGAGMYQAR